MLKVQDLVARSTLECLNGLSFKVENGQILAVVGKNNSGKSLLGQVLTGNPPAGRLQTAGEIHINNYNFRTQAQKARAQCGYLANPVKLEEFLTGFELLDLIGSLFHLAPAARAERIGSLATQLAMGPSLYTIIEMTTVNDRQKIALAAAVIHQPKLLILDEPTQNLDFVGQRQAKQLIREQAKLGTVVVVITNDLGLAEELADQILVLDDGQKLLEGTLAQLINQTKCRARTLTGVMETLFGHA